MFETKEEAKKALTLAKIFFQNEITKNGDYAPSVVSFHLDLIDKAILYIEPKADIDKLCDEVGKIKIKKLLDKK